MNLVVTLFLVFIITMMISFLFEQLDRKYDLRLKYFSVVAKNKFLYYAIFTLWGVILLFLILFTYPTHHYGKFLFVIVYFSLFLCFYHHMKDWKMAHSIYIEHAKLLIKAKEKERKKRKK